MDQIDLILSLLLLANSRTPYSELADILGLSVNAVHKRIRSMLADGIIRVFTAKVSLSALGAFPVLIYGARVRAPEAPSPAGSRRGRC